MEGSPNPDKTILPYDPALPLLSVDPADTPMPILLPHYSQGLSHRSMGVHQQRDARRKGGTSPRWNFVQPRRTRLGHCWKMEAPGEEYMMHSKADPRYYAKADVYIRNVIGVKQSKEDEWSQQGRMGAIW